jgi:hypothetical protein
LYSLPHGDVYDHYCGVVEISGPILPPLDRFCSMELLSGLYRLRQRLAGAGVTFGEPEAGDDENLHDENVNEEEEEDDIWSKPSK